tara:strand:+ start:1750 stop:3276 length:1527 start_codon:yes stop_codon:yes gene_type:complete
MKKFKSLREAKLKASDYDATSEKSKFDNGHRPKVVQKDNKNKVLYLSAVSFKTPKAAQAAADAYLTGYALGGERSANKMMNAHIKNNKKQLVDTSVLDTMEDVKESGHTDVASMKQKVKVAAMAIQKMNQELSKLPDEGDLPTWWTNKVAIAVDKLDGMSDYLDTKVESVNENLVMGGQFKSGDMPNSDLRTSIELLQHHKKMAERQRPKVSDPVLVKSLEDVISQIGKTIKDAEKEEKVASKSIVKASAFIKKTFDLINKKKYLIQSAEVEGDVIEEAMGGFPQVGSKFALKKKHVKMIQDIIKSKGNAAANHIQMKMGYSKSAAQDLIDLAQGRAIYGKKLGSIGSGVVESLSEQLRLIDESYTSLLTVEINEGISPALKKAEKLMGPSKTKDQGIEFVMKGMKVDKKKATQMVDQILKMKESIKEAFEIEKGAKVKIKHSKGKDLYGTVVKGVETKGFKVNGKQGILVRWSNKVLGAFEVDQFAVALMDRKADYQIVDDGVRFDN